MSVQVEKLEKSMAKLTVEVAAEEFEKAMQKYEKEKLIVEQLLAGRTTLEIYGFDKLLDKLL